jgi:hypothetical protein
VGGGGGAVPPPMGAWDVEEAAASRRRRQWQRIGGAGGGLYATSPARIVGGQGVMDSAAAPSSLSAWEVEVAAAALLLWACDMSRRRRCLGGRGSGAK